MQRKDDASVRVWLFSAAAFFGLVILYFMGGKVIGRRSTAPPMAASVAPTPEPAASLLPTAAILMKIKRIEPRKYRREGETPPPLPVR